MKAWEVVGATHDADMCCVGCCGSTHFHSADLFAVWMEGLIRVPDSEGNQIQPVFASDVSDGDVCSVCGKGLLP